MSQVEVSQRETASFTTKEREANGREQVLYSETIAMFRNAPVSFALCLALVPVGVGAVLLFGWWLKSIETRLTVTTRRTTLRRGVLACHINEVMHSDVRNVQVRQSFFQRIMGTGDLLISSAGQGNIEIEVVGIPLPMKVRHLVDAHRPLGHY